MTETALIKSDEHKATTDKAVIEAQQFVDLAKSFVVENHSQNQEAADLQNEWKGTVKTLEAERVRRKRPVLEIGRTIDADFGRPIKMLEAAIKAIAEPMKLYDAKLEKERQEKQARLNAIAEKGRRECEEKARLALEKADEERREAEAIRVEAERQRRILQERAEEERRQTQAIADKAERDKRILAAQVEQQRREAEIAKKEAESDKMLRQAERDEARADKHLEKAETTVAPVVREAPTPEGLSKVKVRTFDEAAINLKELAQAAVGGINVMIVDEASPEGQEYYGTAYPLADKGKVLIIQQLAPRPELLNCLRANTVQLRKLINAVGDTLTIPGVPITTETRFRSTSGGKAVER